MTEAANQVRGKTNTLDHTPELSGPVIGEQLLPPGSVESGVTFGELDSLGRTTGIEATITPDMIGTGSPAKSSIKPAGFGGQSQGHARGHLLGTS